MTDKDYYKTLGVTSSSTQEDIKKAYRKLSKQHHPDVGGTEAMIKEINEAYSVLGDSQKKSEYDSMRAGGGNYYGFGRNQRSYNTNDMGGGKSFEDMVNEMFGGFGGNYGQPKHNPFNTRRDENGFFEDLDINLTVDVTLEHIYKNEKVNISYKRNVVCTKCDGTGTDLSDDGSECMMCVQTGILNGAKCRFCRGSGRIHVKKCTKCYGEKVSEREERIPLDTLYLHKGERKFTSPKYGHFSKYYADQGKKGNLYVKLIEKEHPVYRRGTNDLDLHRNLDVDFKTAILGGKVKFIHLDGKEYEISIPAKLNVGKNLKMSGKGLIQTINTLGIEQRADLILTVNIFIDYDKLTEEQINKIRSL